MAASRDTPLEKQASKVISLPCKMLSRGAAVRPPRCTPPSWSSPAGQTTGDKWEEGRTQRESCQPAAPTPLFTEAWVSSREVTQHRIREKIWVSRLQKKDGFVTASLNPSLKHAHVAWRPEICGYITWMGQRLQGSESARVLIKCNYQLHHDEVSCSISLWCWKKQKTKTNTHLAKSTVLLGHMLSIALYNEFGKKKKSEKEKFRAPWWCSIYW